MDYSALFIVFVFSMAVTPIIKNIALKSGIIDRADGSILKIHKDSVALLGGLSILLSFLLGVSISGCRLFTLIFKKGLLGVIIGGILVFGIGILDDAKRINPAVRLCTYFVAGIIILSAGIKVNFIPVSWVAIPLTLFYIIGAINAFNIIDGMDGLCAGISLIASIGFFFLGLYSGNAILSILSAVLFMSVLGFLPYNFYPAKIFLGNAGSNLLGFLLGTMALMSTAKPYNIINFIAPIFIIGVPVFDMAFAILRRLVKRKSLFMGDREHSYDLLLKRGLSQPLTWLIMCGLQIGMLDIALMLVFRE